MFGAEQVDEITYWNAKTARLIKMAKLIKRAARLTDAQLRDAQAAYSVGLDTQNQLSSTLQADRIALYNAKQRLEDERENCSRVVFFAVHFVHSDLTCSTRYDQLKSIATCRIMQNVRAMF